MCDGCLCIYTLAQYKIGEKSIPFLSHVALTSVSAVVVQISLFVLLPSQRERGIFI